MANNIKKSKSQRKTVVGSKRKTAVTSRKTQLNNNYYVIKKNDKIYLYTSRGKLKSSKKYDKRTYEQDLENARYHQNFKDYKVKTSYGKKVTWRSTKRTQKFYSLNKNEETPKYFQGKRRKQLDNKEFFVVFCYGSVYVRGHWHNCEASSHRYPYGSSVEKARQEAEENFYRIAYGTVKGTGSDTVPQDKQEDLEKNTQIDGYYISYR